MEAFSSSIIINPSKSCLVFRLPNTNTCFRFRSSQPHKLSFPCNFNRSPQQSTTTTKMTSLLAKINEVDQDVQVEEKPSATSAPEKAPAAIMSQAEQILQLAMSTVERPVEFALDVIAGPSISQAPLRLLLAAVAVAALLPGDSWEWSATKAVVSGGLLTTSVGLFVFLAIFSQE